MDSEIWAADFYCYLNPLATIPTDCPRSAAQVHCSRDSPAQRPYRFTVKFESHLLFFAQMLEPLFYGAIQYKH